MWKAALLLAALLSPTTAITSKVTHQPLSCLSANIYFEARGESYKGKLAVKDVTLNRGKNICKVVFARKQFSWTHQQRWSKIEKFLLDKPTFRNPVEAKAWQESKRAAADGQVILPPAYKHYHALYVKPDWTKPGKVIGSHKFVPNVPQSEKAWN